MKEAGLRTASIGTILKGIGPTYAAKANQNWTRITEIFDDTGFERKYRLLVYGYKKRFYGPYHCIGRA
jgi:adenylosuccinate synthase